MSVDIEQMLRSASLHFTKEVHENQQESYCLFFDSTEGPLRVELFPSQTDFAPVCLVRSLDSIGVQTSTRQLLKDLLAINSLSWLAHVGLWSAPDDEKEWIIVVGHVPVEALTVDLAHSVIAQTVQLAEAVLQTIGRHLNMPERKQLA